MQCVVRVQGSTGTCIGSAISWSFSQFFKKKRTVDINQGALSLVLTEYLSSSSGICYNEADPRRSSINQIEAEKFAKLSDLWWDERGPFKPLHAMNRVRCEFIKTVLETKCEIVEQRTLERPNVMRALDVGCGGGILSESLATMALDSGAVRMHVTGIDVHTPGIEAAIRHRDEVLIPCTKSKTLFPQLEYRLQAIEELSESEHDAYDVVIASEVIEHVESVEQFCRNIVRVTKPGGHIIVSTLNRSIKSYFLAILGAEYIAQLVPEGTHEWNRFVTPEELVHLFCDNETGASLQMLSGMSYQPITGLWHLSNDTDVNYIASFRKDHISHVKDM